VRYLALVLPVVLMGCTTTVRTHDSWRVSQDDSPRTSEPVPVQGQPVQAARRDPVRPKTAADPLTKEQVLAIAGRLEPAEAIAEIDRHPLAFPLSKENLSWFEDRLVAPELADYLKKRSQVNWEQLAKPAEPTPPPPSVIDDSNAQPEQPTYYEPPARRTQTTVYIEPQPQTTVVYDTAPVVYGGVVYVGGGYYYGPRYYGARTYYAPVRTAAPQVVYRPGAPAGLYSNTTVVRTGNPTVYVRSSSRGWRR
jgi:hypothetical protein